MQDFQTFMEKATFYYPATNACPTQNLCVCCDRCNDTNLTASFGFGYGQCDLCLLCVHVLTQQNRRSSETNFTVSFLDQNNQNNPNTDKKNDCVFKLNTTPNIPNDQNPFLKKVAVIRTSNHYTDKNLHLSRHIFRMFMSTLFLILEDNIADISVGSKSWYYYSLFRLMLWVTMF